MAGRAGAGAGTRRRGGSPSGGVVMGTRGGAERSCVGDGRDVEER